MEILPTRTDGSNWYDFQVELENIVFSLEFIWNDREGSWYFNLYDTNGNMLLAGLKVTISMPLLARFISTSLPNGDFIAVDTTNQDIMPGLQDLGDRVLFCYFSNAELQAIAAGTYATTVVTPAAAASTPASPGGGLAYPLAFEL